MFGEFNIEINDDNLNESVKRIAIKYRKNWANIADKIKITSLSGGITNRLIACYLNDSKLNTSDTLLFRIYGKNTEKFISRSNEIETMILMKKHDLGPEFYAKFRNGICYEFLPGNILDNRLTDDEYIAGKIAESVAALHFVNFNAYVRESDLDSDEKIFIFPEIKNLLSLIENDYKSNMPDMTDEFIQRIPSKISLVQELESLKNYLTKYTAEKRSLIVFSHNDLLFGNIIYNENEDSIKFIDFEYGASNYQAYDISNHFNEFAGVDKPDYSLFPSREYQLKWLTIYLNSFYKKVNTFYANETDKQVNVDNQLVNDFYEEVRRFTLASHFMWAVWSLVQAQCSQLEFNFVNYSHIRFEQYFKRKHELNFQ